MTDERIAEIRRLCEAATDGPWTFHNRLDLRSPDGYRVLMFSGYEAADDTAFTAAARTAVPELLAECERLRAALADACDFWQAHLAGFVKRTGGDGGSRSEQAHLDRLRAKGQP